MSREENTARLIDYYMADDEADLRRCLAEQELDLDTVLSGDVDSMGTIGDVVVKHLFDYWVEHLNRRCATLEGALPHADEVVMMFMTLFSRLGLRRELAAKINRYAEIFPEAEQPNAIGDLASLTFNNFITSVGRDWMKTADLDEVSSRAAAVGLNVESSRHANKLPCVADSQLAGCHRPGRAESAAVLEPLPPLEKFPLHGPSAVGRRIEGQSRGQHPSRPPARRDSGITIKI